MRYGIVYGSAPVPTKEHWRSVCLRRMTGPSAYLAYASAGVQVIGICFTIFLSSIGLGFTELFVAKQIESYLIHLPMHTLTLHLSRRGLNHN